MVNSSVALADKSVQAVFSQDVVVSPTVPALPPIPVCSAPTVVADTAPSSVHCVQPCLTANRDDALNDNEVDTILCALPNVHLITYDCSRSGLCRSNLTRLKDESKCLLAHLTEGTKQMRVFHKEIRLCEAGMDSSFPTPIAALPDNTTLDPEMSDNYHTDDELSEDDGGLDLPFQPIASPASQPAARYGPLFNHDAPTPGKQECKQ